MRCHSPCEVVAIPGTVIGLTEPARDDPQPLAAAHRDRGEVGVAVMNPQATPDPQPSAPPHHKIAHSVIYRTCVSQTDEVGLDRVAFERQIHDRTRKFTSCSGARPSGRRNGKRVVKAIPSAIPTVGGGALAWLAAT